MTLRYSQQSRREGGLATLAVLALIVLMGILLVVNIGTVKTAFREVHLVEKRQLRQSPWLVTNSVPLPSKPR